jgi:hypothetical protein
MLMIADLLKYNKLEYLLSNLNLLDLYFKKIRLLQVKIIFSILLFQVINHPNILLNYINMFDLHLMHLLQIF